MKRYKEAQYAFADLYKKISEEGVNTGNGTLSLFNVGFYIDHPWRRYIFTPFRKWNPKYAEREWAWYISQDRSVAEIKKYAPIWDMMHGGDDLVNSNYGWQWMRNNQYQSVVEQLRKNPNTRQAWLTIYDGKERDQYEFDTPCTLSIGFRVIDGLLCMSVLMRSNDLWYGFCNDQYCFSKLQEQIADELNLHTGWYYHYAADMHLYVDKLGKK